MKVCLKLRHKNLLTGAASQTRNQIFPTLCFFVSHIFLEFDQFLLFLMAFFVLPH